MLSKSTSFRSIRKAIDEIPVIDCHDHSVGYRSVPEYKEPIASLIREYIESDLMSVGAEPHMEMLKNQTLSTQQKWPVFQKLWKATEHTSYARVTKLIMEKFYGESGMSIEALMRIGQRLLKLRNEWYKLGFDPVEM